MTRPPNATRAFKEGQSAYDPATGCDCPYPHKWKTARLAWHDGYFATMRAKELTR